MSRYAALKERMGKSIEPDNDSRMAASQLEAIKHHVAELESVLDPSKDLPDWVDSLLTEAADRLSKVTHHLQGQQQAVVKSLIKSACQKVRVPK